MKSRKVKRLPLIGLILVLALTLPVGLSLAQEPTAEPTEEATVELTEEATVELTEEPTVELTEEPTAELTEEPTAEPTEEATVELTEEPTAEPTEEPTAELTEEPTAEPTEEPTAEPTEEPTAEPTEEPVVERAEVVAADRVEGQALPGSGWWTGHTVANVGGAPADISVTAYAAASSSTYFFDNGGQTIPVGSSVTWFPNDFSPPLPSGGFQGSAIVMSSQPIKAIVNLTNRPINPYGVPGGQAAAQYRGVDTVDTTVAFPIVKYNFFNKTTTLYVQNAGGAATTVSVHFFGTADSSSCKISACTYTSPSMGPGQMVAVTPNNASGLTAGFIGSAKVTSNSAVDIAGVFVEAPHVQNPATQAQAATGFTPAEYDDTIYVPVYKNNFAGRSTGLQVQNVGTGNVDLALTYQGASGCSGSLQNNSVTGLAPGNSHTFLYDTIPTGCLASVTVKATLSGGSSGTALIAGTISEAFLPAARSPQQSTIYTAFPQSSGTTKVSLPVVKDKFFNKTTGVTCQNVGNAGATNVVYRYTDANSAITYTTQPQSIPKGQAQTLLNPSEVASYWSGTPLSAGTLNAVIVTSDRPLVCLANESTFPFSGAPLVQDKNNYEGFNLTP